MCEFCSNDTQELENARREAKNIADNLTELGLAYRRLANGRLKPHSNEMKIVERMAKIIIKTLVEEWI